MKSSRKTSKVWLMVNTTASYAALSFALFKGMDGAAMALAALPPFFYGAYTGVGHLDLRQFQSQAQTMEGCEPSPTSSGAA